MPIVKETGARLIKAGLPYTTLPNDSIAAIKNPVALAIWVHLCSKPENWIVRRNELMDRFDVGKDRYRDAMRELRALGLVWDYTVRNAAGEIEDNAIYCSTVLQPECRKTGKSDKPAAGSTGLPEIGKLNKERVIKKERIHTNKIRKGSDRKGTIEELTDTSWADQLIVNRIDPSD